MPSEPKSIDYHKQAVLYNDRVAEEVKKIEGEVENSTIKAWCRAIVHQHNVHAKLHREIVEHLESKENGHVEAVSA